MSPRPHGMNSRAICRKPLRKLPGSSWPNLARPHSTCAQLPATWASRPGHLQLLPRRDALVTALIIDAYTSFGDSQFAARDAVRRVTWLGGDGDRDGVSSVGAGLPATLPTDFWRAHSGLCGAFRAGLPLSGGSLSVLVSVVEAIRAVGKLNADGFPEVMPGYETQFTIWKSYGGEVDILSLSVAILIWARVHGIVSVEIAGNIPPFGLNGDALYLYEMMSIGRQFIKA